MAATGTALLDFGSFPGASDATIVITGQTGIASGSLVEAWILPANTADHSADEHVMETLRVFAGNIVAGTGFTIYGINTNQLNEPSPAPRGARFSGVGQDFGKGRPDSSILQDTGPKGTRIYGKWNIAWVWN